jgi:hypothetical protein
MRCHKQPPSVLDTCTALTKAVAMVGHPSTKRWCSSPTPVIKHQTIIIHTSGQTKIIALQPKGHRQVGEHVQWLLRT